MSRPTENAATDLSEVAAEAPEHSVETEQEAVGKDQPDVGDTVTPDHSQ